jgi:hypothetical protein
MKGGIYVEKLSIMCPSLAPPTVAICFDPQPFWASGSQAVTISAAPLEFCQVMLY